MPRHFFPGDLMVDLNGNPAPGAPFTWWSEKTGGSQYTDVVGADGVSTIALVAGPDGNRPDMWGPNNVEVMYCETGASIRYPVYADDVLRSTLDEAFLVDLQTQITNLQTQNTNLQAQLTALQAQVAAGGGGTGGGLPAGTTLQDIPDGTSRLALTSGERNKIATTPTTFLTVAGSGVATTAMRSDRAFTAAQVGAVANLGGFTGIVGRTAAQGIPSATELAALPAGTYIAVDQA